ncbi:unnamed protein product [Euphydryas editha]|uniref:Reverse transcriptase domain-containing protein n=1 Tax=Euphydryas editha TaxID=104508 RepID=A0AAU9U9D9_EUPED|nr:unnamed protein product [Euphydryas editha]
MYIEHFKVNSPLGSSLRVLDEGCCRDSDLVRFSGRQVARIIKKMTRGKSPGHDGLSIEHLQHAGPHLPGVLAIFYSLSTVIAKVLDSLLDERLDSLLQLHDAQFGFRNHLGTETAILSLKHTVQYNTKRRTPVYACFLDLSRAFDLVLYDVLWEKLRERKVPAELLRILQYWYCNQVNSVRWADKFSVPYGLECGVREGGIRSPKLFNLYINDLIVELSSKKVGCRIDDISINNISYADDMVLLSPSVRALRELLASSESYARKHGLMYNVKKSEVMVFKAHGGKRRKSVPVIKLNGSELKRVYQFKYLGH